MNIPINDEVPVKSINQIEINAPNDAAWHILTYIKNWFRWQQTVTETVVHVEITEGTEIDWKASELSLNQIIKNSRTKPVDDDWETVIAEIELAGNIPAEAIKNISEFSHLEIIYYFD